MADDLRGSTEVPIGFYTARSVRRGWDRIHVQGGMMRRVRVAVVVALVIAGLAGCAPDSPAPADPQPTPETSDFLTPQVVAQLDYLDSLRNVDPCGFLDPDALNRIARPSYVGADGEYNSCTARFGTAVGPKRIDKVVFDMDLAATSGFGTPVEVNGTTIRISDNAGEFCSAHLPFDQWQSVAIRVFTAPLAPRADLCPEAIDIAAASIPLLSSRPARSGSPHEHVDTRLARLDACDVLPKLGPGHPNLVVRGLNPWGCVFQLVPGDDSTQQDIAFLRATDVHIAASSSDTITEIDGFPAAYKPGTGRYSAICTLMVGIDAQRRSKQERRTGPDIDIELIRVFTGGGGCDNAIATATELVRLYKLIG